MLTDSLVDLMMILSLLRLFSSLAMPWYHLALTFLSHIVIVTLQFIILHAAILSIHRLHRVGHALVWWPIGHCFFVPKFLTTLVKMTLRIMMILTMVSKGRRGDNEHCMANVLQNWLNVCTCIRFVFLFLRMTRLKCCSSSTIIFLVHENTARLVKPSFHGLHRLPPVIITFTCIVKLPHLPGSGPQPR